MRVNCKALAGARRSPEEALVRLVREARGAAPAVLYLPHLPAWWEQAPPALRAALWMLLRDLPADLPLLLLATADAVAADVDDEARFPSPSGRRTSCSGEPPAFCSATSTASRDSFWSVHHCRHSCPNVSAHRSDGRRGAQALSVLGRAPLVHELDAPGEDARRAMFHGVALVLARAPPPPAAREPATPPPVVRACLARLWCSESVERQGPVGIAPPLVGTMHPDGAAAPRLSAAAKGL